MMKKSPRVLVLVDWNPDEGSLLRDCLRKTGLHCDLMGTDYKRSQWTPLNKVFFLWPRCLWVSIKAFSLRHDYDYVVAWPQVMGMLLGFIKLMTFSNSPTVVLLNTTIVERKNPLLEILRRWFIAVSLKADAFLKGLIIPDNVTVYRNIFGAVAEELMKQSAAVIFPLERTSSPAGETTLVSAMFYGKPVITTKTITTQEYIQNGQNGFLVPVQDPDAIVDAIHTLFSDPDKADEIGRRARQSVLENHTMEIYTKKIFDVIGKNY